MLDSSFAPLGSGPGPRTVTNGTFHVQTLRKNVLNSSANPKTARITWVLPAGQTLDRIEVGLYRRNNTAADYSLEVQNAAVAHDATSVDLSFEWNGTGTDDFPRFAVVVKSFIGGTSSYIIIEEIVKWEHD